MKELFFKIRKTFFTKEFLTFCIIGFLAYLTNQIYYLFHISVIWDDNNHLFSNGIGFILGSIVSYLLNVKFTYKTKSTSKTIWLSVITYIIKFGLTLGITYGCVALFNAIFKGSILNFFIKMIPFFTTAITLVFQFICFNIIFKKSKDKEEKEELNNGNNDTENKSSI